MLILNEYNKLHANSNALEASDGDSVLKESPEN